MSQLSERACEAPGPQPILGLLWYLIYLNTHTHTHTHTSSRRVCDSGPSQFCNHAQSGGPSKNKNKNKNTKSIFLPLHCRSALVIFLFALPLLGLQGCPCPWRPRDSGLWLAKLADEVFVCLFVTDRMEVGGRSSRKRSSITCSG